MNQSSNPELAASGPQHRQLRRELLSQANRFANLTRLIPLLAVTLGVLMPTEFRVEIAAQNIYSYRLAYLIFAPWCLYSILTVGLRLRFADFLVVLTAGWISTSFIVIYGFAGGFASGSAVALDLLLPYLIARTTIRTLDDLRRFLIVLAPAALVIALALPIESVSGNYYVRNLSISIFGRVGELPAVIGKDFRFGLLRAMGPFSHPIMAGLFFASLLPLYWFSGIRGWPRIAGLAAGLATFFTLSSAALIGLIVSIGLAVYDYLRKVVTFLSWPLFAIASAMLALTAHIVSQNGLISVIIRSTFNPQTGYYRLMIWEHGSQSVAENPWFGIGYENWARGTGLSGSVDAFWLVLAMRNGLPAAILLGALLLMLIIGVSASATRSKGIDKSTFIGLAITLFLLALQGFTVHFFGGMGIWFAVLIGLGATFSFAPSVKYRPARRLVRAKPTGSVGLPGKPATGESAPA